MSWWETVTPPAWAAPEVMGRYLTEIDDTDLNWTDSRLPGEER